VPAPADAKSKVRPVAGPVVPLTVTPGNSEELLGAGGSQPMHADATADRVLVKGEPVLAPPGRADDFVWPPGSDAKSATPAVSVTAPPAVPAPKAVARTEPIAVVKPPEAPKHTGPKILQTTGVKPRVERRVDTKPRPPADIPQSSRTPGWFR
jgi:hypothetical protein